MKGCVIKSFRYVLEFRVDVIFSLRVLELVFGSLCV